MTEILPGNDAVIVKLRERLGLDSLRVDGLTLPEFIATAFAIFSYGNAVERENVSRVVLDPTVFFREFPNAGELLNQFLNTRALSVERLQEAFGGSAPITRDRFDAELAEKTALDESLRVFRLRPFMRLSDGRVLILDLQFSMDLCTTGMYWLIFDALPGLPSPDRNVFRDLWGYCFEAYVTRLLEKFYPPISQILRANVTHPAGQIDALLDFGDDVFVVEIKSSLLVLPVKRRGEPEALAKEIQRKFIVVEDGDPKAIQQLARAAKSIIEGSVSTATWPRRIFPIVVTDEPASECLGFNAYLNERFQLEVAGLKGVTPLTVMSVNECEELLAYSADGAFSWADILLRRFNGSEVGIWSVRQSIYDLRQEKGTDVRRNQFLLKQFGRIYQLVLKTYGANEQAVAMESAERNPGP